jgi:XTP/dITP diphosphohydrolase
MKRQKKAAIAELLEVMARLRSPKGGCPWDLEQDHMTLRYHAVEEVYELLDAIEAGDDHEMVEELGDLLLQVIFHCQLAGEREAFDFETVCRRLVDKLVRRHPHVFGTADVKEVDGVLAQWEHIKRSEKVGTKHERPSVFDGIPKHLPALLKAEKLTKKAKKAKLLPVAPKPRLKKLELGRVLFHLAQAAQAQGWSAEELLRTEIKKQEKVLRRKESARGPAQLH